MAAVLTLMKYNIFLPLQQTGKYILGIYPYSTMGHSLRGDILTLTHSIPYEIIIVSYLYKVYK